MPLDFLEFVTDKGFLEIVTLSNFYKSWISRSCAIRLFHRQGNIKSCDIKYLLCGAIKRRFTKKSLGGDKVTASGNGSFASKTEISLGWRAARVKVLNVTGLPKEENAKKPNGIRP